jgi:drug/metabolite transporter (DMT)-like permease
LTTAGAEPRRGLRATRIGVAAVATPVVAWSLSNVIVKIAHASAVQFAFWRLWMGAAIMLAACVVARRRLTWSVIRASAPAGVLFGFNIVLFFSALKDTSVADVLIIAALQPGLVLFAAGPMFGERVAPKELALLVASVGGVIVFVLGSRETAAWSLRGDLFALAALLVFTVYFLLSKRVRQRVQAVEYMATVTVVAALVMTPVALLSGSRLGGLRVQDWLWLAVFVVAAQGGHLLLAWAHRQVDATVSSLLLLGEPPITAAAAFVFLGEAVTWLMAVGGLIAIGSLGVIVRRATREEEEDLADAVEGAPP